LTDLNVLNGAKRLNDLNGLNPRRLLAGAVFQIIG
jgi:hypothetical protein